MDRHRVVITGMGLVSPLPHHLSEFQESLFSGRGAVRPFHLSSQEGFEAVTIAAQALFDGKIKDFDVQETGQTKAIKKSLKVMSREIQMAVASSCRALNHANIQIGQFPSNRIGISFGSDYIITTPDDLIDGIRACCHKHGDSLQFDFSRWAAEGLTKMQPLWQLKYLPNMPASHIAILHEFHGPSNSMTLREASIGACIGESVEIIASGRADIMLVGTTGTRLHPVKMVHAIQQEELTKTSCKPFDRFRDGTVLGEGAGSLILEELNHAEKRRATIFGEVVCGSYRIRYNREKTDLRREVIGSVLRDVLRRGKTDPGQIGFINAHGLGNRSSDIAEAQAINDVFGSRKKPVPVLAVKGFFGNLGAGGGAVELIAGILPLQSGSLFPSLHFTESDAECPITLNRENGTPAGNSFIKIAVNPQGQASAVLVRKL